MSRPVPFTGEDGQRYMPVRTESLFAAALIAEWQAHDGKNRKHYLRWQVFSMPLDLYETLEGPARERLERWRAQGRQMATGGRR